SGNVKNSGGGRWRKTRPRRSRRTNRDHGDQNVVSVSSVSFSVLRGSALATMMRVVLVGPAAERVRLRQALVRTVDIVGEVETLAAAREFDADALVFAPHDRDPDVTPEPLTRREIEVLDLLAEGLPNKAIAARLTISDQTVKFHVSSICGKLGAANRTDAVRRALRRGLITL